jgi:hypothetical protein
LIALKLVFLPEERRGWRIKTLLKQIIHHARAHR